MLKVGARVMLVVNYDVDVLNVLVNGSCGIVESFTDTGLPVVRFISGVVRVICYNVWELEYLDKKLGYGVKQLPLILSWSITIHKCQGSSLDCAELDLGSGIFTFGQMYVGLSRVRSLSGLYLSGLNLSKLMVNKKVLCCYKSLSV